MYNYSRSAFVERHRKVHNWNDRQLNRAHWATRHLEEWARSQPTELQYMQDGMAPTARQRQEARKAAAEYLRWQNKAESAVGFAWIIWAIAWQVVKLIIMLWLNEMINSPASYQKVMEG